jgi:hypothetical protein
MIWRALCCLVMLVAASASDAAAGPWTPARGHGQVIVGWTFYETHDEFSRDGDRQPFQFDGAFRKSELNPYFETGLTDRLALVGSLFASSQEFGNSFGRLDNAGLGDMELGLRYRLTDMDRAVGVAVQGLAKLAAGGTGGTIALTNGQTDLEGRVALGGSLGRSSHPPFWNVDAGYRFRSSRPADEIRVDAALGAYVRPRVMLLGQVATITGMRNASGSSVHLNPTLAPDYDLYRVQGSVVVQVAPRVRVQGGAFAHAWGRNTGAGSGVLASVWLAY